MPKTNEFVKKWLILAVGAIAAAGIYSLPPVVFRGPFFQNILPVEEIFASSLVVHVDLSVLVWMLAIGSMLWSMFADEKKNIFYKFAFYTAAYGTALIAISPFVGASGALKNNYIPVLQNPVFFIGLGLFASAIMLQVVLNIASSREMWKNPVHFGLNIAAIIIVIAMVCFVLAGGQSPGIDHSNPQFFYEFIFWGGGHILQMAYTTLLLVAWFMLLEASGYKNPLPGKVIYAIFAINLISCLIAPFFYLAEDSTSLFTTHMKIFPGIAPLIAGIASLYAIFFTKTGQLTAQSRVIRPFLVLSILLFGYGGVLSFMISGINVTIPAHYHGSIVGISIAFMGIVYYFMPLVGFNFPKGKIAAMQPFIYGIGQAMHITGLAIMGGYGALRKDAASSQHIDTILGKTLFFSGGTFAIIGGFMFIVAVFSAMRKKG